MEHAATGVGLWLGSRANGHDALSRPAHAVGIGHDETGFVRRIGFEVQDAAGKHVRRNHVDARFGVDPLPAEAQQRQCRFPLARARLPVGHLDGRVAVVVSLDEPLEAEIEERRRFDHELPGNHHLRGRDDLPQADPAPA